MRWIKSIKRRLLANTLLFTVTMFLIAFELKLALGVPFLEAWLTLAAGEFIVMLVGAPLMYALSKRIDLRKAI